MFFSQVVPEFDAFGLAPRPLRVVTRAVGGSHGNGWRGLRRRRARNKIAGKSRAANRERRA